MAFSSPAGYRVESVWRAEPLGRLVRARSVSGAGPGTPWVVRELQPPRTLPEDARSRLARAFETEHAVLRQLGEIAPGTPVGAGSAPEGSRWVAYEAPADAGPRCLEELPPECSWMTRVLLAIDVCRCLSRLGDAGAAPDELLPASIWLSDEGRVSYLPAGFAHLGRRLGLPAPFTPCGPHAAPELRTGRAGDARSAVFSVAAWLRESLAAAPAEDTPPPGSPQVHAVESLLAQASASEPNVRPPDPAVLADALERCLAEPEARVALPGEPTLIEWPQDRTLLPSARASRAAAWLRSEELPRFAAWAAGLAAAGSATGWLLAHLGR